eukprot:4988-Heterococcus_DN1.PRE.1
MALSWMQRRCGPWSWWNDLEALIRARCSACLHYLFSTLDSQQQQRFLEQAARTVVREGCVLVGDIYSMAADSFKRRLFVQKVFDEVVCAHFGSARKQQSVAAPVAEEQHFHCVADLIAGFVAASADLTAVLAAALSAMLEASCADGIRWLRQQYCTSASTAAVIDSALKHVHYSLGAQRNLHAGPFSAASLEALLEAGEADCCLRADSMLWLAKDEWLARRGPSEQHAESAKVLMAAAGAGCEALLVGESGDGLLACALNSSNAQQLAVLLSDTALVKAVLTAQCSYARSPLHYAVELSDN